MLPVRYSSVTKERSEKFAKTVGIFFLAAEKLFSKPHDIRRSIGAVVYRAGDIYYPHICAVVHKLRYVTAAFVESRFHCDTHLRRQLLHCGDGTGFAASGFKTAPRLPAGGGVVIALPSQILGKFGAAAFRHYLTCAVVSHTAVFVYRIEDILIVFLDHNNNLSLTVFGSIC